MMNLDPTSILAKLLHANLHQRLVSFAEKYSPEFPAEDVVTTWLNRFYCLDPNVLILVYLDDSFKITAHSFIEVQALGSHKVVLVHQLEYDKKGTDDFKDCIEYIDKLVVDIGAHCAVVVVSKNVKVYEKFGYGTARTFMTKANIALRGESEEDYEGVL